MPFDLPDYSYGVADAILINLDYLILHGSDSKEGHAMQLLEDARYKLLEYKDLIFNQVMES